MQNQNIEGISVIVAGSRSIRDYEVVNRGILKGIEVFRKSGYLLNKVISGGAGGVDSLGERWAKENKVPLEVYPANWQPDGADGKTDYSAGFKRNILMAGVADALIAIWDGKSNGTRHMIETAKNHHLHVYVYIVKQEELNTKFDSSKIGGKNVR